jgi:hypothetical protein
VVRSRGISEAPLPGVRLSRRQRYCALAQAPADNATKHHFFFSFFFFFYFYYFFYLIVARHEEREGTRNETLQQRRSNGDVTPPDTDTDTDTDTDKKKPLYPQGEE